MATQTLTYQQCQTHVRPGVQSDDEKSLNLSTFFKPASEPSAPIPTVPALKAHTANQDALAEGLPLFTLKDALMATKNYYLHQRFLEFSPSKENVEAVEQASTDLAYLYENIQYADDLAKQVLEDWIEIWNFEALLANKNNQA
ncbi:hypothetical protein NMY22_g1176 [Coprinellus aureogranulatus]|nr:hypothetical protein NMY22_g1176 [Coprinellus aureogranulatus]